MNKIPDYRIDYTATTKDIYDTAKWKGYKYLKGRNLDSWLSYGWSMLFKRKMNDHDLRVLQDFLQQRENVEYKIKHGLKLDYKDRVIQNRYIGKDGYIYMNKMMYPLPKSNPKETARLEKLLEQAKEDKLKRYEEYEMRCLQEMSRKAWINNHYKVIGKKIYRIK
ncbi:hypothetical protein OAJ85_00430 [Pseudomonadota bacterium]|nr:hypothetical protein [Pseudomonadota bacterium]